MPRFGFIGPSYSVQSRSVADEECINLFAETNESGGAFDQAQAYGGREYVNLKSYFRTPGLSVFSALPQSPVRGSFYALGRLFVVAGAGLYELSSSGAQTSRGTVANDGNPVSIAFNNIQLLIVSGGHAYCFTLATNALLDVTGDLAGIPVQVDESDTYFIVAFQNSNKYQMSQVLDGTTWPGQLVNEVSVFPDNITSIIVNHRELWVCGQKRSQPFQDTGSTEVFDPIAGALIETGSVSTFSVARVDNSIFWVGQDERGAVIAWRSSGYTPSRISTHAVEVWLSNQANVSQLVSYSYQDRGHLFWVLYVPGGDCSWVYDVTEQLWHKRRSWNAALGQWGPHYSWNHVFAFGMHLVGDWNSGNLYQMNMEFLTDNGTNIRRLRRAPTVRNEKRWIYHTQMTVDFQAGTGPQPPLLDGNNAPRQPQAMLRWSNDGGQTWSNEHWRGMGFAGQYAARVFWMRLGRARDRVYELVIDDPVDVSIVDAYLETANG
jgi:hypothetical protein